MALVNSSGRHKEPFVQWRESTSMDVGDAEQRSGRRSTLSMTGEESRHVLDMPTRTNTGPNSETDSHRSRIPRVSRRSSSGTESPLQQMTSQRLPGTRSGSQVPVTSINSSQFTSSQTTEKRSQSSYSYSLERQHVGQSSNQPVSVDQHDKRSPERVRGNSRDLGAQCGDSGRRGQRARHEGEASFTSVQDEGNARDGLCKEGDQLPQQLYSFYDHDSDIEVNGDSGDDAGPSQRSEEPPIQDEPRVANEDSDLHLTESQKRRQRRQAQAARVREGDRRVREGLPRNFLLVDEYTKEPYGLGVGEWRKELMLLSKALDPSIGNINRQPENKLREIGDWIQHTWQYSSPIKWEFVKEVIARGVCLRRAELWKRMRLNQGKPEGMDDKIWESLELQYISPNMTMKIENCRKANACRGKFGRTGPAGEIGVRERLREKLKRSPSPSEISMEMERPKGYTGRSKRRQGQDNVSQPDDGTHAGEQDSAEATGSDGSRAQISSGVMAFSESEVAQHPAFMRIMQRLEALEQRQVPISLPSAAGADNTTPSPFSNRILAEDPNSTPLPSTTPTPAENQDNTFLGTENMNTPTSTVFATSEDLQDGDQVATCMPEIATAPPARKRGRPRKKVL